METKRYAAEMLRAIGLSPKYKGYAYILYMLDLAVQDISRTHNISAQLYSAVCERYHVSPIMVERNTRFAIRRGWEEDYSGKMRRFFQGYGISYIPTNREFICVLSECICNGEIPAPVQLCMW